MRIFFCCLLSLISTSCLAKNYYVTVEELVKELTSAKYRKVLTINPWMARETYRANDIKIIRCTSKKGEDHELANSPAIEMRITDTNGKRVVLYFDTVEMKDSVIYGWTSRIFRTTNKGIPVGAIRKIEVQNGHKNYHYAEDQ